ncbi:MAG: MopE-related protein [Myxococcota bacterium]
MKSFAVIPLRGLASSCLALALAVAGCGSDTGSASDTGSTAGADTTSSGDTSVVADGASDTAVETTPPDATVSDATVSDTTVSDTTVSDATVSDATVSDTSVADTTTTSVSDTGTGDTGGDTADASDVVTQAPCSTDGGVGCACTFDSDCNSHICLQNEGACSAPCSSDDDCAFTGFHCGLYTDFLTTIRACLVEDPDACTTCDSDDDCADGYACVTLSDGKACAYRCSSSFDCLSGTSCDIPQGGSFSDRACLPDAGTCSDCYDDDGDGYGTGPDCPLQDCRDDLFGVHPNAAETCNELDDDCDGATDEDFDLTSDIDHCGDCGTACSRNHTTPTCDGSCHVGPCTDGYEDCDHKPETGCEVNLADRCGSCDGSKNACGGCAVLDHAPDTACGTCGKWTCDPSTDGVRCVEPASCDPSLTITQTTTLSGDHSYNDLTIGAGGTLSVGSFGGIGSDGGSLSITAISVHVGAGGRIDASGKGGGGNHPGAGLDGGSLVNDSGAGGGYGGRGGNGARDILQGGASFGTAAGDDIAMGSDGGTTQCRNTCAPCAPSDKILGGRGGGLIVIKAKDVVIDGSILADGLPGQDGATVELGAGGGSGGGIWIEADSVTINDSAIVSANGGHGGIGTQHPFGNGQTCLGFGGSGGGGGRIKIRAATYTVRGVVRAQAGAGATGPAYVGHAGAPGTVETPAVDCVTGFADCDGDALTGTNGCETNLATAVCGRCGPFPGALGDTCGTCDSGHWVCGFSGDMACSGDSGLAARNACGGCSALANAVGAPCGGGCGTYQCSSNETVACSSAGANACGGCDALAHAPGDACGTCNQGTWTCDAGGLVCDNADLCENNLVVDATSLELSGSLAYDHVTVKNGGVLHVTPYAAATAGTGQVGISAKTIVVEQGASIDANGAGGAGTAPGQTMTATNENSAAGGGGYGGAGGDGFGSGSVLRGGAAFGTAAGSDLSQGSNGGGTHCRNTTAPCKNTPADEQVLGGAGGGMVDLTASVSITIDGSILANGAAGQDGGEVELGGGGGSGGGIRLSAPTVSLGASAVLAADGGHGGAGIQHGTSVGFGGGGGGGGRIKVVATLYAPPGPAIHASAGAGGTAPVTYQGKAGAAGTVDLPPTP